ncbi:MAG: hypothetical protein UEA60_00690 [Lachnospiraceae bacterium]|nr:hypothetical protein [Lachnospiraceae bacterium]
MSNLNLLPGNYNVNISNQNYDGVNVNPQKSKGVGDEKLTLAGQTKTDYLKLAVGEREKQLEKLGLLENEDGKVLLKGNIIAYDKEKITMEEEEKNSQLNGECETCANRKYQDGSDEMVSFKSATHISPDAAATAVRAHEGEHVSNAYDKAAKNDGEVVNASVAIHTSVCPECGRTYVSGGTTTTTIRYNKDNYAKNAEIQDATVVPGKDVDALV